MLWAPLFALPFGVGLVSSATRHERALVSGLATTVGSGLMTVVAYDLGPGGDWVRAWQLTAVLAAYFSGTVFYIKSAARLGVGEIVQTLLVASTALLVL